MVDWAHHVGRILARMGEDVTFTHGGTPSTVRGVFFMPYQAAQVGIAGVTGTNPHFAGMSAELPSVAVGDTITRGAVVYTIKVKKADAPGGFTVLELQR
jgi:hypothetical protein